MTKSALIVVIVAVVVAGAGVGAWALLNQNAENSESVLSIYAPGNYQNGVYDKVVISSDLGDEDVLLSGITILKELIIQGGGSHSINLNDCTVDKAKVLIHKNGGESPRLNLIGTNVGEVEIIGTAIIEGDANSDISSVNATNGIITIQGNNTSIGKVTVKGSSELIVNGGHINDLELQKSSIEVTDNSASVDKMTVSDQSSINLMAGSVNSMTILKDSEVGLEIGSDSELKSVSYNSNVTVSTTGADTLSKLYESDQKFLNDSDTSNVLINGETAHIHSYVISSIDWTTLDKASKNVSAIFVCSDCESSTPGHEKSSLVSVNSEVILPTCSEPGHTHYSATDASTFVYDSDEVSALGHDYSTVTYVWSDSEPYTCVAKAVCSRDSNHILEESGNISSSTLVAATFSAGGTVRLTATFTNDVFTSQVKDIETEPTGNDVSSSQSYQEEEDGEVCTYSYSLSIDDDNRFVLAVVKYTQTKTTHSFRGGVLSYIQQYDIYEMIYDDGSESDYVKIGSNQFQFCNADGTVDGFNTTERQGDGITDKDITPRLGNSAYGYYDFSKETNGKQMQEIYYKLYTICEAFSESYDDISENDGMYVLFTIDLSDYSLTADEVVAVWKVFILENPMYYWLSNTIHIDNSKLPLEISPAYAAYDVRKATNDAINKMIEDCSSELTSSITDIDRVVSIHNFIVDRMTYAYKDDGVTPEDTYWAHNLAGAAIYNTGVCESYSDAFQVLCQTNVIDCIMVTDTVGNHVWNLVYVDDGWYGVDVTWDDKDQPVPIYDYLGMSGTSMGSSHPYDTPMGQGVSYLYALPELSERGIELVSLFQGTYDAESPVNLGMYRDMDAAFEAMTNINADYTIKTYDYSRVGALLFSNPTVIYHIESTDLPAVKSIAIFGNVTDAGNGYYFEPPVFVTVDTLKVHSPLVLSHIQMRLYALDLGSNFLTLIESGDLLPHDLDGARIFGSDDAGGIITSPASFSIHAMLDVHYVGGEYLELMDSFDIDILEVESPFIKFLDDYTIGHGHIGTLSIILSSLVLELGKCDFSLEIDECDSPDIGITYQNTLYYPDICIHEAAGSLKLSINSSVTIVVTDLAGNEVNSGVVYANTLLIEKPLIKIDNYSELDGWELDDVGKVLSTSNCSFNNDGELHNNVEFVDGFYIDGDTVRAYIGHSKDLVIPEGITTIGIAAFENNAYLETVTLPESVRTISEFAFAYCTNLATINLNDGLTTINSEAFAGCSKLNNVVLPDSVIDMGAHVFSECKSLQSIVLPHGMTDLPQGTLDATGFTSFILPDSVKTVGNFQFARCEKLEYVDISTAKQLGMHLFVNSGIIDTVVLPDIEITSNNLSSSLIDKILFRGSTESENYQNLLDVVSSEQTGSSIYCYSESEKAGCWHYSQEGLAVLW